jgi:hypothetical protein
LRTISDIEPICLGQGDALSRFHPESKAGQGDKLPLPGKPKIARAVRDLIIRGCWLRQFADPAAIEDRFYNIHRDKEFLEYKTLSFVRNA